MRTYSTSQVVRLLELHPDWEFAAPETRELFACTVDCDGMHIGFATEIEGAIFRDAPIRSDWTRVKPAKLERVKLGTFKTNSSGNQDGLGLGLADAALRLYGMASNTTGTWTLYAVKEST